jgi:hypothetical protein
VNRVRGYASRLSRQTGQLVAFCLDDSVAPGSHLPVLSLAGEAVGQVTVGPYGGERETPAEPWREGLGLPPRATYKLDPALAGGVYTLAGEIPFVHRRLGPVPVAVLLPSNTATAFNPVGGRSFYKTNGEPPANVLSFQRPLALHLLLGFCHPLVRWLASDEPPVPETTFLTDSDLERADALDGVEVLVVVGRSEYWTRAMRENFDAFVDRGGRALLLCSEVMFWQVRVDLERQLLFRYGHTDPHPDPLLCTTTWREPALQYPVYPRTGGERWHGGINADDEGVGWGGMRIVCPGSPLLAGSDLAFGDAVALPDAVNWDGAPAALGPDGVPRIDFGESPPWRHEVVGYNPVKSTVLGAPPDVPAISLWTVLRRTPQAGTVIHGGTMGWCGSRAIDSQSEHSGRIRSLIVRMLEVLLEDAWPFSSPLPSPKGLALIHQ